MDKPEATVIENIGVEKTMGGDRNGARNGGVNLYNEGAVVLIPTPSPDPKGITAIKALLR